MADDDDRHPTYWCLNCGTLWTPKALIVDIPRRSQPHEVVEQIVGDGDWWWRHEPQNDASVLGWIPTYAPKGWKSAPGRYVPAVPPVVKGEEKESNDYEHARWLRWLADSQRHMWDGDKEMLRRIADRLEREREGR